QPPPPGHPAYGAAPAPGEQAPHQPPPGYGAPPPPGWGPPAWQQQAGGWQQPVWQQPAGPPNGPAVTGFVLSLAAVGLLFLSAGLSTIVSLGLAIVGTVVSRNGREKV